MLKLIEKFVISLGMAPAPKMIPIPVPARAAGARNVACQSGQAFDAPKRRG